MRYIIHSLLSQDVASYQRQLVDEIVATFGLTMTKDEKLAPHFTLKYWVDVDDVEPLERLLQEFARTRSKASIRVGGFGHFGDQTIFVPITLSPEAQGVFAALIAALRTLPDLQWDQYDAENLHFHATIAEEVGEKFPKVWEHLKGRERTFEAEFDNLTLVRFVGRNESGVKLWKIHRSFPLIADGVQ